MPVGKPRDQSPGGLMGTAGVVPGLAAGSAPGVATVTAGTTGIAVVAGVAWPGCEGGWGVSFSP